MKHFYSLLIALILTGIGIKTHAQVQFPDGTELFGYKESGSTAAFYTIYPSASAQILWEDTHFKTSFFSPIRVAWFNGEKLCAYAEDYSWGSLMGSFYVEYDWATGTVLSSTSLPDWKAPCMLYGAYNPNDGVVYGYGMDANNNKAFITAPANNPGAFTVVKNVTDEEYCHGVTWNSTENIIVGIRADASLVKINPDGTQENIFNTGIKTAYKAEMQPASAIAWSETQGVYYWNPMCYTETGDELKGFLYSIDTKTSTVSQFPNYDGLSYKLLLAICKGEKTDIPEAPSIAGIDYNNANSVTVLVTLPTKTETELELSGELSLETFVDGQKYGDTKSAAPGTEIAVEFNNIPEGTHNVSFSAMSGTLVSKESSKEIFFGNDTPNAPQEVVWINDVIGWKAVDSGINSGYIDSGAIQYEVYINDNLIATTAETFYLYELSETGDLHIERASVKAICNGKTSEAGISEPRLAGNAMPLPLNIKPNQEDIAFCTFYDANKDNKGWRYLETEGAFESGYSETQDMNDWIFLPPVELTPEAFYIFTMENRRRGAFFSQEYLEVKYGNAANPDAMTGTLIREFQVPTEYTVQDVSLRVPTQGRYYIGIHCKSSADQYGILVKNIKLEETKVTDESPANINNLKIIPGENGALQAQVSFSLPTTLINGTEIENSTDLSVEIEAAETITLQGKPGEAMNATIKTVQGTNKVYFTVLMGNAVGEKTEAEVYTGEFIPSSVVNLSATVSEDMQSVTLKWEAPLVGIDGGYINPENIKYNVYKLTSSLAGDFWDLIEEGTQDLSYTYHVEEIMQDYYEFSVKATNIAGVSPQAAETSAVLGRPHDLPMYDDFNTGTYIYGPWITYIPTPDYRTQWGILPLEVIPFLENEYDNAVCAMGLMENGKGKAGMPIFTTKNLEQASIEVDFWTGENAASNIHISGTTFGLDKDILVGSVVYNGTWNKQSFNLPQELLGKDWVQLFVEGDFPEGTAQWILLKSYNVNDKPAGIDNIENNGQISIKATEGGLAVFVDEPEYISIFTPDGKAIYAGQLSDGNNYINLQKGIYIVACGNNRTKVAVK